MDVFEFILIPTSIIIGLGMAELLGGVARVVRGELKAGPLHSVWVALVFLAQLQFLWASWDLHGRGGWTFVEFIIFMIGPIVLYVGPAILFPRHDSSESLDVHLLTHRVAFFSLAIMALASFSVLDWVVSASRFGGQDMARLGCIGLFLVLAGTKNRRTQWIMTLIAIVVLLWFVFFFTPEVG